MKNIIYKIKDLDKSINTYISQNITISIKYPKLTRTQIQIINCINNQKNKKIYQKDLEKKLNMTRASISGVLKTMEKNQILTKQKNKNDARINQITLNESFSKEYSKNKEKLNTIQNIVTSNINSQDIDIFLKVLNKMKSNISKKEEQN